VYTDRIRKKSDGFTGRGVGYLLLSSWLTRKECSYDRLVLSGSSSAGWKKIGESIYMLS